MSEKAARDTYRTELSRREFSKILAIGAASTALPPAAAAAPEPEPTSLLRDSPELSAEAEAQYKMLISKHGTHLSEEQKADVRRLIDQGLKTNATLRSFHLDNADEPAHVFRARLGAQG